ncbi:hypothetical protein COX11_00140, partial [Candidatus Berkelbacteria bacterium CG23_combo_of_CG06-09_8_20_14_all_41_73]
KVPQKIDIEDRIVGPLTMVQFVYAVVGGGAAYLLLNTMPSPLNWILAIPVAIFTFLIVFVKVNGRPFGNFLKNLLIYTSSPKTRIWHKGESNVRVEIYQPRVAKTTDLYAGKRYSKAEIEKVAEIIDKRGRINSPPAN